MNEINGGQALLGSPGTLLMGGVMGLWSSRAQTPGTTMLLPRCPPMPRTGSAALQCGEELAPLRT